MDSNQIFQLIDSILPLEVCLYHQILPLSRQEKHLHLGMVAPEDSSAKDYARRMLSHLNCSLIPQKISAEEHQSLLSAYLTYKGKSQQPTEPVKVANPSGLESPKTAIQDGFGRVAIPSGIATLHAPPPQKSQPQNRAEHKPSTLPPPPPRGDRPPQTKAPETGVPAAANSLPQLKVRAPYLSHPLDQLAKLSPQELLQELLARVLLKGIGRLYFERQSEGGRVLWSQEGVMQSALEGLPMPVFQGLLMEVKRFFNQSSIPVEQPKQVDMERMCGQAHLLLVLQLTPGERGEEATLQVLRGKAMKFYKEQKVADLSQDALQLAQLLQRKLSEIGSSLDPSLTPETLGTLPAIDQMLKRIDEQLQSLKTQQTNVGGAE